MGVKKWLMKQQWRVIQIRGIWGLFYGILLLAIAYYEYIPFFVEMGSIGPFVFAGVILFTFLILGYIYDRVLVMWAPSQEVTIERNPYQYIPSPKDHIFWFPIYSALLDISEKLAEEYNIDKTAIQDTREYFSELEKLRPERREDIDKGIKLREEYVDEHRFVDLLGDKT
ncbi:MAG: hypothetical protein ACFFF9_13660 [Candidatus Thorarchaeota archaeon]